MPGLTWDGDVKLSGSCINCIVLGKFLGVMIDNHSNFSLPIDVMCNKVFKIGRIFYKLRNTVPNHVLVDMYYGLVYLYGHTSPIAT